MSRFTVDAPNWAKKRYAPFDGRLDGEAVTDDDLRAAMAAIGGRALYLSQPELAELADKLISQRVEERQAAKRDAERRKKGRIKRRVLIGRPRVKHGQ